MATKNDQVILDLQKEIDKKKSLLEKTEKYNPVTNCQLWLEGRGYNIHVEEKENLLLLIGKIKSMETSLKEVLPEEKLVIQGFTSQEWISDLVSRFKILNVKTEKNRLKQLEKKLHNLLSTDKKVELEIEDLKSQI